MRDEFLSTHSEISLVRGTLKCNPDFLDRVKLFFRDSHITTPESQALQATRHVQTHERIFREYVENTFCLTLMKLPPIERMILETAILQYLLLFYKRADITEFERRSHSVLIAMVKQKLMEVFLDLDKECYPLVLDIASACKFRSCNAWIGSCEHAIACARTVEMISRIDACWMYLPNVHETFLLGTDLIVFSQDHESERGWCAQIMPPSSNDDAFHIAYAMEEENKHHWVARLINNYHRFAETYPGYYLEPCVVTQPIGNNGIKKEEIALLREFLIDAPSIATNKSEHASAA